MAFPHLTQSCIYYLNFFGSSRKNFKDTVTILNNDNKMCTTRATTRKHSQDYLQSQKSKSSSFAQIAVNQKWVVKKRWNFLGEKKQFPSNDTSESLGLQLPEEKLSAMTNIGQHNSTPMTYTHTDVLNSYVYVRNTH